MGCLSIAVLNVLNMILLNLKAFNVLRSQSYREMGKMNPLLMHILDQFLFLNPNYNHYNQNDCEKCLCGGGFMPDLAVL